MPTIQIGHEKQRGASLRRAWSPAFNSAAFRFGIYVFWLTSFPMSGKLLSDVPMSWFTLPHAIALLAMGRWLTPHALARLLPGAAMGTALLTAFFAFWALDSEMSAMEAALVALGISSAPLSVRMGTLLGCARWPVGAAAIGLLLGNLFSYSNEWMPGSDTVKLIVLACLIPGMLWPRISSDPRPSPIDPSANSAESALWRLLPFIALFQMVSGLLYGHLWPTYRGQEIWPGVELLFYVIGVVVAAGLVQSHRTTCVLSAVGLATLAFAAHHSSTGPVGHHVSIFLMMVAVGLVDLVLLACVLAQTNLIRAYGYAIGVMVGGIVAGEWLVKSLSGSEVSIALLALALLNLGTVAYFVQKKPPGEETAGPADTLETAALLPSSPDKLTCALQSGMPSGQPSNPLPAKVTDQLSHQEIRVLQEAISHHTYRDIAESFDISESSVKTYMQRIYRKLGIYNRKQLDQLLVTEREAACAESHPLPADAPSRF